VLGLADLADTPSGAGAVADTGRRLFLPDHGAYLVNVLVSTSLLGGAVDLLALPRLLRHLRRQ